MFKQSTCSCLLRALSYADVIPSGAYIKDVLYKSKGLSASAGYGKSTVLASEAKIGDLAIAMTGSAVTSLTSKLRIAMKNVKCMSLERAL